MADEEFAPEVVEAVARAVYLSMYGADGGKWEAVDPRYQETVWGKKALAILRTLRGLGVLAGPGEVVVKIGARCPFEDDAGANLEPEQPCPVCGDLGTWDAADAPSKCIGGWRTAPRAGTEGGQ